MRRLLFLLVWLGWSVKTFACVPIPSTAAVSLNKKGVTLQKPSAKWIESVSRELGLDSLRIDRIDKVPYILVGVPQKRKVVSVTSSIDLRPWFKKRGCVESWEALDRCRNLGNDPEDDRLLRRLDQAFYSKVICLESGIDPEMDRDLLSGKGRKKGEEHSTIACEDPDFLKWELRWPQPWLFVLKTDTIGQKWRFASLNEAKASLHRINALLGRVLPGARFPENPGENRDMSVYSEEGRSIYVDPGLRLVEVLKRLIDDKFLQGITRDDIRAIAHLARGGKDLYYLAPTCLKEDAIPECAGGKSEGGYLAQVCRELQAKTAAGWQATSNGNRIKFSATGCPKIEVLR